MTMPEPSTTAIDRPTPPPTTTPTVGGYLVAATLTVVLFAIGFGVVTVAYEFRPGNVTAAVTMGMTLGFTAGVLAAAAASVVGLPLTVLAHFLLRRVTHQGVHVAVFGVIGVVTALSLLAVFGLVAWTTQAWVMAAGAGVCAALSRYLVGRRQFGGLRAPVPR